MKVTFPQAKELKNILPTVVSFLSEGTFKANKDGIFLSSLDPANVAVILLDLYNNMFTEFEVDEEEKFTINLEDLKKILTRAKLKDQLTISTDKEKNKLLIEIKSKARKLFSLPLIESEGNFMELPSLDLPIKVEMDSKAFYDIIESAKVIADEIKLIADPNGPKISFVAEGELKDMKIDLTPQDESVLSMEVPSKASARYSVDYLYKLSKVAIISDTLLFRLDSGKPIWIDYKSTDKFKFGFVLAPRE
ncbi:DNA polymerase III sliding clamp [Nanobdella aerobiophila]|uniref:DNA polymerase sliding clamp n=1 Tax=Nanobdella aerobiophila TaxID=2586965 RepID=A0A915SCK3_9ARCH|nr:proliferating cell nuclear antigen (pcna) [Nanobdella aerobiophila]BBL45463.1 DNA polymerase III sliding clamp [Nanobdella aerobiophila]